MLTYIEFEGKKVVFEEKAPGFIRVRRKAKGLTQADLAKRCKVKTGAVQAWEAGDSMPKATNIPTLAKVIGVDPLLLSHLVDDFENPAPGKSKK
jgi:transcriptional regulator with XRE-family HTH domain